jgi:hypothetical protein
MKQWLICIYQPETYEIDRLNSNNYQVNYLGSWVVNGSLYRYTEFVKDIKLKTLINIFKLADRLTIQSVKIWDRDEILADDVTNLSSFQSLGELSTPLYIKPKEETIIPSDSKFCTCCRKYKDLGDFLKFKSGIPKKTCTTCTRVRK